MGHNILVFYPPVPQTGGSKMEKEAEISKMSVRIKEQCGGILKPRDTIARELGNRI
jgi:hypothetical protein